MQSESLSEKVLVLAEEEKEEEEEEEEKHSQSIEVEIIGHWWFLINKYEEMVEGG